MARKKGICSDCKLSWAESGDFYYLKDEIWAKIAHKQENLCILCAEDRLGRKFQSEDFTKCYINHPRFGQKSIRLISRLLG